MVALESAVAGAILVSGCADLAEATLAEYQPEWMAEARKIKTFLALCSLPFICHYTLGPLLLTNFLDHRLGIIQPFLSLTWKGTRSRWILFGDLSITTIGVLGLIYGIATSLILPQAQKYLSSSTSSKFDNPTSSGFVAELPKDQKDHPVSINYKLLASPLCLAKPHSFYIFQTALIALISPPHRIVYCVALACLSVSFFKNLNKPRKPAQVELSFSWEDTPKKNWHPTIEKCAISWHLHLQVNDQNQYLCPKGHLIAENKHDLIEAIENKRRALLDSSQVDVSKTNWYNRGFYSHTTYESELKLPKKDHMVCTECAGPEDSINFKCYGKDQREPWHLSRNAPRTPYTATAKSITSIDDPDTGKDAK